MAMTLSKVQEKESTVTVLWDGETVDVGYRPGAVTAALLEKVQHAANDNDMGVIGILFTQMLAWWDVLDDQGERIPVTPENVSQVPLDFAMNVLQTVQGAMRPPASKP